MVTTSRNVGRRRRESFGAKPSRLPLFLAAIFLFIVAYASIEPLSGWSAPPDGALQALWRGTLQGRWVPVDFVLNVLVYVPLAFLLSRMFNSSILGVVVASSLSLSLELVQAYLPVRHPSAVDWLANSLGASCGGVLAEAYAQARSVRSAMLRFRQLMLPGLRGDYGIALLLLYLIAHANPGFPLFASTYVLHGESSIEPGLALLQSLHVALNLIGFGLFADLLMRRRLAAGMMLVATLLIAIASKSLLAAALLKPGLWGQWLSTSVVIGLIIGAIALLFLFWLPASQKRIACNISILVALALPILAPDWLLAKAPLRAFEWSYGHLLNFNSLTQTLLRLWPLLASLYLFATAGNPIQDGGARAASSSPSQ